MAVCGHRHAIAALLRGSDIGRMSDAFDAASLERERQCVLGRNGRSASPNARSGRSGALPASRPASMTARARRNETESSSSRSGWEPTGERSRSARLRGPFARTSSSRRPRRQLERSRPFDARPAILFRCLSLSGRYFSEIECKFHCGRRCRFPAKYLDQEFFLKRRDLKPEINVFRHRLRPFGTNAADVNRQLFGVRIVREVSAYSTVFAGIDATGLMGGAHGG